MKTNNLKSCRLGFRFAEEADLLQKLRKTSLWKFKSHSYPSESDRYGLVLEIPHGHFLGIAPCLSMPISLPKQCKTNFLYFPKGKYKKQLLHQITYFSILKN